MKNRTRPVAAAIPNAGRPASPTTSPPAPASFAAPSAGSQERGTPTSAEFARTNRAGMKSATAIPAVTIAVVNVIATYAVFIGQIRFPQSAARRTIGRVILLVSFRTGSSIDALIYLTTPVQKR